MAHKAWDRVTPKMIKNCWRHADIQHNPIILYIPQTLTQRGWNIVYKFADSSSGMTLPQAEDALKEIFDNQYNDNDWLPALKTVTETEPGEDVLSLIKGIQEESHTKEQLFIPVEYTKVAAEVTAVIRELEQRNQIFEGTPSADTFIEPEFEREVEDVPIRTDDELVAEVLREQAIERGEIVEIEDDDECEEGEPAMTMREVLLSVSKL